jgi:hypothetical protein
VRRIVLLVLGLLTGVAVADAREAGQFIWYDDASWFGGFSAIEVYDAGRAFVAVSDRAVLVHGRFVRDPGGRIVDMIVDSHEPLLDAEGQPLRGRRDDSEGLALTDDGHLYTSFEGLTRVRSEGPPPRQLPRPAAFDDFAPNAGFEALALTPAGALLAIPEDVPDGGDFPVWRYADGGWSVPFHLPRQGAFLPTGADVGPDGRLYVLERALTGPGFRSRVRVFGLDGSGGATLFESRTGQHDNLEGLSVWADDAGLVLTMIADDNFRFFQRTEVVELRLPAP